ncbi:sigma 54-interacting transcriptional regulator [Sporomusa termitida]|uniref:Anaerobic nitric oxide reductase transcription regulator NorR n=1 Tax=Sporomusa termitida TaxID=2377 RepID=A0A517DY21_9FIRM|nr:sigma 54-interacting transcriptional regulator [Sporomusa termitida]QDR82264.1 Anaerobic nitric oxide reductase transcription regulator NorR [Sporomusa termitida]
MVKVRKLITSNDWSISSREMQDILNSTHDAIIAVNKKGIIILFNTAAERLLGIAAWKAYGEYARDIIPGSRLHCVLESGRPELNQRQEIGDACILTNRVPVRDEDNGIVGAVAVFRDMTEIRQLAEEMTCIKEMKKLLEAIINTSQDVISVVDDQGKIILVNPAYTRLIGMRKDEVMGQPPTIDIRQGESVHLRVMQSMEAVRGVPLKVGPASREVIINAAPLIVDGRLRGSVAMAHDIAEYKFLSAGLNSAHCLMNQGPARYTFNDIVASGSVMRAAVENACRAALTPATVLLAGESGTGKELFAHAIHSASPRQYRRFIRVNCAAIPETLLESELFGYEAGAFSGALKSGKKGLFEEADGGTLFLDEIGEIPPSLQVKLLRVLQEREITRVGGVRAFALDLRIIAATNKNLEEEVRKGNFRKDLFYRISVLPITIPPLRQRRGDLPELSRHLLSKLNREYGRSVQGIADEAAAVLAAYNWPGNVRELENVLGRALINMQFNEYTMLAAHLPPLATGAGVPAECKNPADGSADGRTLAEILAEAERRAIAGVVARYGGNRAEAARHLNISLRSLYYKLEKYGLSGSPV